ncbi:hypothetical protein L218DRAFT_1005221 [Marasmius fiardii PR-910]|nr:hypothetical protein L218DRAFT_1005221 [Marasmius fiardii PR-910]
MSQTTTISSQVALKLKSQTLVKSRANGLLTKYSHILELEPTMLFQVKWKSGDITWLPYHEIDHLDAVGDYLEAMDISEISGLVSGGHELPKLASELEETDLHVGMMEWLEGIDEKDRKEKEGLELTQDYILVPPSFLSNLPLSDMAITNWLRHITNDNGKPSQTILIGHLGQGQINFLVTPLDIHYCLIMANQLLKGKPLNSLTIPTCHPHVAQLFNNDHSGGGCFSVFNTANGSIVPGKMAK